MLPWEIWGVLQRQQMEEKTEDFFVQRKLVNNSLNTINPLVTANIKIKEVYFSRAGCQPHLCVITLRCAETKALSVSDVSGRQAGVDF